MISVYILHSTLLKKFFLIITIALFCLMLMHYSNQYSQLKNNLKIVLNDMKMTCIEREISVFQESVFILYLSSRCNAKKVIYNS